MSVHENDKTVSHITILADPTLASVTAAESAVAAFKLALKELGESVPANDVRAVLTTSGLRLEVTEAPSSTVEHYGTPAPVEEVAEFLGDGSGHWDHVHNDGVPARAVAPLAVGDRVRITGNGPGGAPATEGIKHYLPVGEVGTVTGISPVDSAAVLVGDTENFVSLRHLERA